MVEHTEHRTCCRTRLGSGRAPETAKMCRRRMVLEGRRRVSEQTQQNESGKAPPHALEGHAKTAV